VRRPINAFTLHCKLQTFAFAVLWFPFQDSQQWSHVVESHRRGDATTMHVVESNKWEMAQPCMSLRVTEGVMPQPCMS
jgi:hypothetical protein